MPGDLPHTSDPLLCENCGYPLGEPGAQTECPECGRPVQQSLPDRRTGSPFQRRVPGRWLRTSLAVITGPTRFFATVRIDRAHTAALLAVNIMTASLAATAGWLWAASQWATLAFPVVVGVAAGFWLLTYIETLGLRMFGRQRGWRVTPTVAWVVCDHASVGWVVSGALLLGVWIVDPGGRLALWPWLNRQAAALGVADLSSHQGVFRLATFALAFLLGMLVFETLVYFGVRACRFANTPGARPIA